MADLNSTIITNLDAAIVVKDGPVQGGVIRQAYASVTTATIQSDGDVIRFFRVHSSWIFVASRMHSADLSGGTAKLELGLYLAESGAVLDDDCFQAVIDVAAIIDTGFVGAAAGAPIGTQESMFTLGGAVAANDDQYYDVAATVETADTSIAGLVGVQVLYIDPAS